MTDQKATTLDPIPRTDTVATRPPLPPFTRETAMQKVRQAAVRSCLTSANVEDVA